MNEAQLIKNLEESKEIFGFSQEVVPLITTGTLAFVALAFSVLYTYYDEKAKKDEMYKNKAENLKLTSLITVVLAVFSPALFLLFVDKSEIEEKREELYSYIESQDEEMYYVDELFIGKSGSFEEAKVIYTDSATDLTAISVAFHDSEGKEHRIVTEVLIEEDLMEYEKPFVTFVKLKTKGYEEEYYNLILHK